MAAKAVVKKLEKRHNEMPEMDVEEFLFACNQVDEFNEKCADFWRKKLSGPKLECVFMK